MRSTLLLSLTLVGACAQVEPQRDFDQAGVLLESSTGRNETFELTKPMLSEEELHAILEDGLSLDEALRVALLNNRELQAELQSIGIAHADWVQAQLLTNPSLDFLVRVPTTGGRAMLEAALNFNMFELWRIADRSTAAERGLEATILRIVRSAGERIANTRSAYFAAVADAELILVAEESLQLAARSFEAVQALRESGSADRLDESLARGPLLAAQLALRTAQVAAANSMRTLVGLLSLKLPVDGLTLSDAVLQQEFQDVDVESLVELAQSSRLDLRSIEQEFAASEARLSVAEHKAWGELSAGGGFERMNGTGGTLRGPAFSFMLPIFDQNQAQIARVAFRMEQLARLREAAQVAVTREVRQHANAVNVSVSNLAFYREQLLPQAEQSLALANASYNAGNTTLPALIQVQRQLLQARTSHVLLRLEAATSASNLQLAVGAPIPDP